MCIGNWNLAGGQFGGDKDTEQRELPTFMHNSKHTVLQNDG